MTRTLRVLGSVDLRNTDGSAVTSVLAQPKRVALLCYLALARPRGVHSRDKLLGLFWPERDDQRARNALRQSLFFLRRSFGDDLFECRADDIGLRPDALTIDLHEMEADLEAGDVLAALRRNTGPLLDGFFVSDIPEFDDWLDAERRRLRERLWKSACAASQAAEGRVAIGEALELAIGASKLRPLHEKTAREVMRLHARHGDRTSALQAFATLSDRLARELNIEPHDETAQLADRIRTNGIHAGEAPPLATSPEVSSPTAPEVPLPTAQKVSLPPTLKEPSGSARRLAPAIGLAVAAFVLIGVPILRPGTTQPESVPVDGIAVRSAQILSTDPDAEQLARGVQEEVVTALLSSGLHVLPPAVVREAEAGGAEGAALAKQLNVRYELVTTLQRSEGDFRTVVRLTDWRDGRVVWSDVFEARSVGLLGLRAALAQRFASTFTLDGMSNPSVYRGATQDVMPMFVAAVGLMGVDGGDGEPIQRWQDAETRLTSVLARAPGFGAAWARLALLRFRMFWLGADASPAGVALGVAALDSARHLDPEGPDTRLADAYHAYHIARDWSRVVELARELSRDLDADADVALLWAMAERRRGNFGEAAQILESRLVRYPSEVTKYGGELVATYRRLGRTSDADRILEKLRAVRTSCALEYNEVRRASGASPELDRQVRACGGISPTQTFWHELRMRRPEAALAAVEAIARRRAEDGDDPEWMNQQWAPFPLDFWRGPVYEMMGDEVAARDAFSRPIAELRRLVAEMPGDYLRRRFLVMAYAGAGLREDALRSAAEMARVAEASGDVWDAKPASLHTLLQAHIALGDMGAALDMLEALETDEVVPWIPVPILETEPLYDPLRSHPRYRSLVERIR